MVIDKKKVPVEQFPLQPLNGIASFTQSLHYRVYSVS